MHVNESGLEKLRSASVNTCFEAVDTVSNAREEMGDATCTSLSL